MPDFYPTPLKKTSLSTFLPSFVLLTPSPVGSILLLSHSKTVIISWRFQFKEQQKSLDWQPNWPHENTFKNYFFSKNYFFPGTALFKDKYSGVLGFTDDIKHGFGVLNMKPYAFIVQRVFVISLKNTPKPFFTTFHGNQIFFSKLSLNLFTAFFLENNGINKPIQL